MASRAAFSRLVQTRTLARPWSAAASIRGMTLTTPKSHLKPLLRTTPVLGQTRYYAVSEKTHEPASKDTKEMAHNAATEIKQAVGSVFDAVSGKGGKRGRTSDKGEGASGVDLGESGVAGDLKSVQGLLNVVPRGAIVFGAAGVVPYIATSATTIWFARQAWLADQGSSAASMDLETALSLMYHNETIQVTYGAVLLSFLGAIHWGFEFSKFGGSQGVTRYALGVAPAVLAWPTLLLSGQLALAAQWATFTAVWYMDMIATGKGWTPTYYSTYRFALTAVVGGLILLTLGASSYWSPSGQSRLSTAEKLARLSNRHKGSENGGPSSGVVASGTLKEGGEMRSEPGQDAFVKFENVREEEEKKIKAEEEEKKAKAEEAEKKKKESKKKDDEK